MRILATHSTNPKRQALTFISFSFFHQTAIWLLGLEAEIETAFGAAIDKGVLKPQEPPIDGTPGASAAAAPPAETTGQVRLADRLYGAMSLFMPYDDD